MGVGKRKKAPITRDGSKSNSLSSKKTKEIINKFHQLLKRRNITTDEKVQRQIDEEIESLGGMQAYQHASTLGQSATRGGDSSHVFIAWLQELRVREKLQRGDKMSLLEIGALKPDNYSNQRSFIDTELIDLRSNHPDIVEQDFLQRPLPASDLHCKDAISASLVLNFVPTPTDRGLFLLRLNTFLKHHGYLFMVLPAPCVTNSRYLTRDRFVQMLQSVGFTLLREKIGDANKGARLAYWLLQKAGQVDIDKQEYGKKKVLKQGSNLNNFCILL
ncbi:hypothetical protein E3P99_01353 [Wallemia hederae]|uniref:25S rRNA adenine-N(1) methyltransferase n=1 Tax=Wallemia hederae TaxID=1540922 RepID=A0A4T0FRA3_9BASI|nr:hypothetical protein E3P99_01353 [Wallemia hederae]